MPPKAIAKGHQRTLAFFRGISVSQRFTDTMRAPTSQEATKSQIDKGEVAHSDEERDSVEEEMEEDEAGDPLNLVNRVAARFAESAPAAPASGSKARNEQDDGPSEVRNDKKNRALNDARSILRETGAFKIPVDNGSALDYSQASTSASLPARRRSSKLPGAFGAKPLPQESPVHLLSGTFPSAKRLSGEENGEEGQEKKKGKKKKKIRDKKSEKEQRELRIREEEKRRRANRMKAWEDKPELELSPERALFDGLGEERRMEEEERMEKEDQRMEEEEELEEGELRDEPQERSHLSIDARSQQLEEEEERGEVDSFPLRARGAGRSRGRSSDAHSPDLYAFDGEEDEEEADEDGDEEMDEEEEEEMDEEEEEELGAAGLRVAVAEKIIRSRGCAFLKDRGDSNKAQIKALEREVRVVMDSPSGYFEVPVTELRIEDEEEIDPARVNCLVVEMQAGRMRVDKQVLLGWSDDTGTRIYVVDGRHRLMAYKTVIEKSLAKPRADPSQPLLTAAQFKVTVEIVKGGKLAALVKKLASERRNTPTAFEKVRFIRYIMAGFGMIDNPAYSMQYCKDVLNQKICGLQKHSTAGIAMYTVKAACFNDNEAKFMMKNSRLAADNTTLLKLYCTAKSVNQDHAFEILQKLDGEMDKNAIKPHLKQLRAMNNSVSELLQSQGYTEDDADEVQSRVFKNKTAFSSIRRLMAGRNRLSRVRNDLDEVLVALERCWPPVTFLIPQIAQAQCLADAPSTLFIIDSEAFYNISTLDIPKACVELINAQESRLFNFLVVGGECGKVEARMKRAIEEQRMQRRRNSETPLTLSEAEVGTAEVSLECAPHDEIQGGSTVTMKSIRAVMMRASNGILLDDVALSSFMRDMKIHDTIGRTCLHLLSYDPELDACKSKNNSVFVYATTAVAAIAVAARCSFNRITTLPSLSPKLGSKLKRMQARQDDKWEQYMTYKEFFTVDGRMRTVEGARITRKRKSKSSPAI